MPNPNMIEAFHMYNKVRLDGETFNIPVFDAVTFFADKEEIVRETDIKTEGFCTRVV